MIYFVETNLKNSIMNQFDYNQYGREQTGFDNSIDHSLFGHWSNPEYRELCQDAEIIERENHERSKDQKKDADIDDDWLPF